MFFGGEPILNWDAVVSVIECAEKTNIAFEYSLVTNATLLTDEHISYLAKHGVGVGISIDGPKMINDKNRIYRNSSNSVYDDVIKKIELLKKYKCEYGLSLTTTQDILDNKKEFICWLKDQDVKNIFQNLMHFEDSDAEWEKIYKESAILMTESFNDLVKNGMLNGRVYRHYVSLLSKCFKFSDCAAVGANQIVVKPNRQLYLCQCDCDSSNNYLGMLGKESFDEIMSHNVVDFWTRREPIFNPKCVDCECIFVCGGGCPTQAKKLFDGEFDYSFCVFMKSIFEWMLKECYLNQRKEVS